MRGSSVCAILVLGWILLGCQDSSMGPAVDRPVTPTVKESSQGIVSIKSEVPMGTHEGVATWFLISADVLYVVNPSDEEGVFDLAIVTSGQVTTVHTSAFLGTIYGESIDQVRPEQEEVSLKKVYEIMGPDEAFVVQITFRYDKDLLTVGAIEMLSETASARVAAQ